MRIHTIGHSNLDSDELLARLAAFGVRCVVDVRRSPFSRRHPHFCRAALESDLSPRGIAYVHEPGLGGRRPASEHSQSGGLEDGVLRAYADHMQSAEFLVARERVERLAERSIVALLCAEGDPAHCHRSLIADELDLRGHQVVHILGRERSQPHEVHASARLSASGRLQYPPRGAVQGELFT